MSTNNPDTTEQQRRDVLTRLLKTPPDLADLRPDEAHLFSSFSPTNPPDVRSKALLVLSSICQRVRASRSAGRSTDEPQTRALAGAFGPAVASRLSDPDENAQLTGISFLVALFQTDVSTASHIFQQFGAPESLAEIIDLSPSFQVAQSLVQLFSQACGQKLCRQLLSSQILQWLEQNTRPHVDVALQAGAITALVKFMKGTEAEEVNDAGGTTASKPIQQVAYAEALKNIILADGQISSKSDAIEGLAYLSSDPDVKRLLSSDRLFLRKLFSLVRRPKGDLEHAPASTLSYGVLAIITNLCSYRPRLTEEQTQMEKLRQMAKQAKPSTALSNLEDDEVVKQRIRALLDAGVMEVFLPALLQAETQGSGITAAKSLLNIVEDKENRGQVLQGGGVKVLSLIIRRILSAVPPKTPSTAVTLEPPHFYAIQALAKLTITSSPVQVFGPNDGAIYDAIRPLSLMLQHGSASLLQRFEALMAFTNLSSHNAETATRIAKAEGLMSKVEFLLLEDHTLIRRASMELICNLIAGSDYVFERYGAESSANARTKLHILVAMSNVEDLQTSLAAAGALATVTSAQMACENLIALQLEKHRVFPILARLIDPSAAPADDEADIPDMHPGLAHRAVICVQNIFNAADAAVKPALTKDAQEAGLLLALANIVQSNVTGLSSDVLSASAEMLKAFTGNTRSRKSLPQSM